ncbi:MAG TPA: type II/IV secretion system protein, partial [Rhodanobacteraceae bacterium]|nr:type II/IV secretion system protein [Rhodanobacteraceae bacterium]
MATAPQRANPIDPLAAAPELGLHRRLELDSVLATLRADGLLAEADALRVRADGRSARGKMELNPLVLIANEKLINPQDKKPLSLEVLTHWLADKAQLPYLKIDPMKIDASAVTAVISHAYAQRYRILPVAVSPMQVVIATCEPFDTRWQADLGHILRRDIQRVVVSPIDLNRYLAEFYGVQRSIQKARDAKLDGGPDGRAILNFEQLLELGKAGDIGADDRHVVHIVDWLLQYAFDQRASDIHLEPRRDMSPIRFRIDGVMHK